MAESSTVSDDPVKNVISNIRMPAASIEPGQIAERTTGDGPGTGES
jgi:hypothetical protein